MGIWMGHFRKGFAWSENPDLQFNWHPLLMTLGMIYLYGNGKNMVQNRNVFGDLNMLFNYHLI